MGKVKIDMFSVSVGTFGIYFYKKCLLSSPLCFIWSFPKSLNLIGRQGMTKRVNFRKEKVKQYSSQKPYRG